MIGPVPTLPGALGRAMNAPIPAARLYAWRVGFGLLLIADVLALNLADFSMLHGPDGYTQPGVAEIHFTPHRAIWSLLRYMPTGPGAMGLLLVWLAAAVALTAGWKPRLAACVAWVCATSILYANPYMHSGGDRLRGITLFVFIFMPAVTRADVKHGRTATGWPMRFMVFQLMILYFFAGLYKFDDATWKSGMAMYYVAHNDTWCLAAGYADNLSVSCYRLLSWGTVAWEMGFPFLYLMTWSRRTLALGLGVVFHLGSAATLEVSTFPWYSLACYLPLLPWERWLNGPTNTASQSLDTTRVQ